MHYQDIDLACSDCRQGFVWSIGEQEFMEKLRESGKLDFRDRVTGENVKGKITPPKRCPDCREYRKSKQHEFENRGK